MIKKIFCIILINIIVVSLFAFTGCSSSKRETTTSEEAVLTGGQDTQVPVPNIKLSSESFLGTGRQLPGSDVIRSITIFSGDKNQDGLYIIESKEDIGNFLDLLNSIQGNLRDYNPYNTLVAFYKFEFDYNMSIDSTKYVESLSFDNTSFLFLSHTLEVTNFSYPELSDKFDSFCVNPK